ncbi:3-methyl-2-oxobutanoate hydroxymethyltransferase [Sediminicurvatus halobius]|uniref:3-methyl-2-oxobutanoate hydroxymethyltransferase n=1 Tax=Sediminicurvatus halobius TaxID=2182432 RepID=A0A2U2N1G6_9GAMM|nr:3-methyl-2-oxobutanoate hydroxymethyltransferase [Spiribacter halobius]PWG62814.1 3-methyl-2-oxobutanoate hydroxymethyltransferase [Spiribacter halobius]UEX77036.1 3-methyl-2-oxobutanoate hydroxymethyltransferase [Spiribacter halobius]
MYSGNPDRRPAAPVTVSRLRRMKSEGKPIACLTAYDYSLARVEDAAGVDFVLVGDSLGNVVQGRPTTLPVTVDDIVYHTRCVVPACERALVVADMPFLSYTDERAALDCAARLMKEGGAQMVKLEGAGDQTGIVAALARAGVPVCAHLGLQPQLVHKMGGYRVQGRDEAGADALLAEARQLEAAGADVLLVECIPAVLGERLAGELAIPVIGIGAGAACDGQILVVQDVLGITPGRSPRFARDFLADGGSIQAAIGAYVEAVRERRFPTPEHSF